MYLTLLSVSPVKDSDRNLLKLSATKNTAFGKQSVGTYYMFIIGSPALEIGQGAELDLSNFEIVEREYTQDDKQMTLKYLYPKR